MERSNKEQRQQQTRNRGYRKDDVVKPQKLTEGPSSLTAQTDGQTCKVQEMMEQVVERGNMAKALERVRRNKGAAGIDKMETEDLLPYLHKHWADIKEKLLRGDYKPSPVRRVEIPKPDGGIRQLGIPTVLDRLIQQAIQQILTPIIEPKFSEHSYGFRPGRKAHDAVTKAREYNREGYEWVVDIDLEKFFDRVNHDILMAKVARQIEDKRVLRLIRRYLESGIMVNGVLMASEEGTPQGGPLSPLLANIMLDDLDKELEKRKHRFVRYADDCNIYVRSERAGKRVMESVSKYLEGKLKLKVNQSKSAVDKPARRKFLGFSFTTEKESRIRLAPQTVAKVKDKIRDLTKRSQSISIEERIRRLNRYLKGWMAYYCLAETPSIFKQLDGWIRRRLRMCLLKQWKKPASVRRNLVALGLPVEWARDISCSRKGYWRLSLTPQLNKALGTAFWERLKLVSLGNYSLILC